METQYDHFRDFFLNCITAYYPEDKVFGSKTLIFEYMRKFKAHVLKEMMKVYGQEQYYVEYDFNIISQTAIDILNHFDLKSYFKIMTFELGKERGYSNFAFQLKSDERKVFTFLTKDVLGNAVISPTYLRKIDNKIMVRNPQYSLHVLEKIMFMINQCFQVE